MAVRLFDLERVAPSVGAADGADVSPFVPFCYTSLARPLAEAQSSGNGIPNAPFARRRYPLAGPRGLGRFRREALIFIL